MILRVIWKSKETRIAKTILKKKKKKKSEGSYQPVSRLTIKVQ